MSAKNSYLHIPRPKNFSLILTGICPLTVSSILGVHIGVWLTWTIPKPIDPKTPLCLIITCLPPDKTYPCSAELHLETIRYQTRSYNRRSADNIMLGITTERRLVVYLRWFLWSSGNLSIFSIWQRYSVAWQIVYCVK